MLLLALQQVGDLLESRLPEGTATVSYVCREIDISETTSYTGVWRQHRSPSVELGMSEHNAARVYRLSNVQPDARALRSREYEEDRVSGEPR